MKQCPRSQTKHPSLQGMLTADRSPHTLTQECTPTCLDPLDSRSQEVPLGVLRLSLDLELLPLRIDKPG